MVKSLYIHIPFCDQICSYCDFPKVFSAGQDTDAYLDALITELTIYEKTFGFADLKTVYIGGGTPTILKTCQLDRLFVYLHSVIDFHHLKEVSIEANPESLNDIHKIARLKAQGVTRVSLGVQTFQENHLRLLQRSHCQKDTQEVVHLLAEQGFEINLDMIYSIPSQTLQDWENDLDLLLKLPITHVSAYSLILEEHTKFYIDYMKDQLELVPNEVEAQMFELAIEKLTRAGFEHYEISNFTRDRRSGHNVTYWENDYYIGAGLGAHGHIQSEAGAMRYENTRSITAYKKALKINKLPVLNSHILTKEERIEESMFLGLRLIDGVNLDQLSTQYHQDILVLYRERIDKLLKLDYISLEASVLKLTKKGLMMANDVFEEFLL